MQWGTPIARKTFSCNGGPNHRSSSVIHPRKARPREMNPFGILFLTCPADTRNPASLLCPTPDEPGKESKCETRSICETTSPLIKICRSQLDPELAGRHQRNRAIVYLKSSRGSLSSCPMVRSRFLSEFVSTLAPRGFLSPAHDNAVQGHVVIHPMVLVSLDRGWDQNVSGKSADAQSV